LEPHLTLNDTDRSALEMALRLRDRATAPVTITVAAVGPVAWAQVLRETLGLGVDRVRLIQSVDALAPDNAADGLAAVFREDQAFDLILGGHDEGGNQEGLVARLTALALGVPYAGRASRLAVHKTSAGTELLLLDANGRQQRARDLPSAAAVEAGLPLRPYSLAGYLAGLEKPVEIERWPKGVPARPVALQEGLHAVAAASERPPRPLTPSDAAQMTRASIGLVDGSAFESTPFEGAIEDLPCSNFPDDGVVVVLRAGSDGSLQPTVQGTLHAARLVAACENLSLTVLLLVTTSEQSQRCALGRVLKWFNGQVILLAVGSDEDSTEIKSRLLTESWSHLTVKPRAVVGEPWTEGAFATLSRRQQPYGVAALRIRRVVLEDDTVTLVACRAGGKLSVRQTMATGPDLAYWITLAADVEVTGGPDSPAAAIPRIQRWTPSLNRFYGQREFHHLLDELKQETGISRLSDADFIIDVGYGVGNRDGYEGVIEPLERALCELGVRKLMVGGSRKVTEELRLLSADRQIGQTGTSVNPRVLLAIGISGAPQHLGYIGTRATILAFNRDPEAPIMTLNQRQRLPRVFPIVGDLFETVPAFTAALLRDTAGTLPV
jgi:hypothetical protein